MAAWTAAHSPRRVERLILNTPGDITNKPEVMATVKNSSLQAVRDAGPESARKRVEWLFYDTSLVTDELVALRLAIYTQPGFERAMENIVAVQDWEHRAPFVWSAAALDPGRAPRGDRGCGPLATVGEAG